MPDKGRPKKSTLSLSRVSGVLSGQRGGKSLEIKKHVTLDRTL